MQRAISIANKYKNLKTGDDLGAIYREVEQAHDDLYASWRVVPFDAASQEVHRVLSELFRLMYHLYIMIRCLQ